jgi:hypothetical protein
MPLRLHVSTWYDECNANWLRIALRDWEEDEEGNELGA